MNIIGLLPAVISLMHTASALLDSEIISKEQTAEDVTRLTAIKFVLDQLPAMLYDDSDTVAVRAARATSRITLSQNQPSEKFVILDTENPKESLKLAEEFVLANKI